MGSMKSLLMAASVLAIALVLTYPAMAFGDDSNWPTLITFTQTTRVGDLTLPAGTYEFYLTSGPVTRNVIMIYSRDAGRWEGMVMGVNDNRINLNRRTGFTFIEAKNGAPRELEYWFYPGWNRGIKLLYPHSHSHYETMAAALTPSMK